MGRFILALDAGTTGVRAILFDKEAKVSAQAYQAIPADYPKPGWLEQDPEGTFQACLKVMREALKAAQVEPGDIAAIGIATQRSTNLLWERASGKPLYPMIGWQDTRTAELCQRMDATFLARTLRALGLVSRGLGTALPFLRDIAAIKRLITASWVRFSPASALAHTKWMLESIDGAGQRAKRGELAEGTLDSWLVYRLTKGRVHATDFSNASASGMFDPYQLAWSSLFLRLFDIPSAILPEIRDSGGSFGMTEVLGAEIPIAGVIADQQAALFGEGCFAPGDVKCTHGTGTFLDMNVGNRPAASLHGLLPMIAWKIKDETVFMLEGFIPATGALMAWLKDGLGLIEDVADSERLAKSVPDSGGVAAVPALMGLGAPYWDPAARGTLLGLTLSTRKAHVVRAFLEGIALECRDILIAMEKDSGLRVRTLIADGGASKNDFLLEGLADMLGVDVQRPAMLEATALGAAFLAGLAVNFWESKEQLLRLRRIERSFKPNIGHGLRSDKIKAWKSALKRSKGWAEFRGQYT